MIQTPLNRKNSTTKKAVLFFLVFLERGARTSTAPADSI
jgi:hypothetical protein